MPPKLRVSPMPSSPLSAYRAKKMLLELAAWYKTLNWSERSLYHKTYDIILQQSEILEDMARHLDLSKRQRRKK